MTNVLDTTPAPSTDLPTDPPSPTPSPTRGRRRRWAILAVVAGVAVVALAAVLWARGDGSDDTTAPSDPDAGAEVTADWTRYTVDARDTEQAVYFDLDAGRVVDAADPGWDLSFRRTTILTNSGVSGEGDGGAMDLGAVALEDATAPATRSFAADEMTGENADEPANPGLEGWYIYDFASHVVSTSDHTYLVRGASADALVQFDSYYCADEEPGCVTFRYRLVPSL